MNWLAHIFISKNSIDYQLGNLLADPLKGKSWDGASAHVQDGFRMHASIDSFTDSNKFVLKSKSRLRKKGYLKGVIVDIAYDYLLLKNWYQYSKISLESFINTFYKDAEQTIKAYPNNARGFIEKIIESKKLTSYSSFKGLEAAFQRIDNRLSERILTKESANEYLPDLKNEIERIEQDFLQFFPQLIMHFKSKTGKPPREHWLK